MSGSTNSSESTNIEVFTNKIIIGTITKILTEIIEENKINKYSHEILEKQKKLKFYCKSPASVNIDTYIERILKYSHIEESTLILSLIFIDRVCDYNNILLNDCNIHRIIFTSIILAIKVNEDDYYSNVYYSKVGGITIDELNSLEYDYVRLIRYNVFVKNEIYDKYKIFLNGYKKKI